MKGRLGVSLRYGVLIGVGLLMLYPLLWMVGGAFKPNHEIFNSIGFIPQDPTLEGFKRFIPGRILGVIPASFRAGDVQLLLQASQDFLVSIRANGLAAAFEIDMVRPTP